jgi:YidC/Oxa1 family membrane protein insertase
MSSLSSLLYPLEWVVAWIMVGWHTLFTWVGLPAANGWTWVLSIVGLVLVIRTLLIPLFVRQIRSSRKLQLLQPEIKKIQDKYKGRSDPDSRQAMTRETMDLYKTSGTNPFASCLPILLQMPIFLALFNVLNNIPRAGYSVGPFTDELRQQANDATIFGAQLSDTFLGAETMSTQVIAVVLVLLMTATQFWSQRQLFMKNMPPAALDSPFAKQQKLLLYVLPVVFAVSGLWFPLGVIMYWFTSNLFTTAQQYVVIQRMPSPGSPAEKALEERRRRKAERKALRGGSSVAPALSPAPEGPALGPAASNGGRPGRTKPAGAASGGRATSGKGAKAPGRPVAAAGSTPAAPPSGRAAGQRSQPKRGTRSKRKRG